MGKNKDARTKRGVTTMKPIITHFEGTRIRKDFKDDIGPNKKKNMANRTEGVEVSYMLDGEQKSP